MAIVRDETKRDNVLENNYTANESLASSQYCAVSPVAASTGKMKVGLPGSEGALVCGVVQNSPAADAQANVQHVGICKVKANGSFNAGIELQANTSGKALAAAAEDYVFAISLEAANAANHEVSVLLVPCYQKNA
jgi:hypothetical protein